MARVASKKAFTPEGRKLRQFLRFRLKAKGWTYQDLAQKTGLSELKIRRSMSNQDFKVEELIQVLHCLDVSLFEGFGGDFESPEQEQTYTLQQETLITEEPRVGLFFLKLRYGHSIEEALAVSGLSQKSLFRSLRLLENVGLLKLMPKTQTIIRTMKPSRYLAEGPLAKVQRPLFMTKLWQHFQSHSARLLMNPDYRQGPLLAPFEMYLTPDLKDRMGHEIAQLLRKYRQISVSLKAQSDRLFPVSGILAMDQFDAWKATYEVLIEKKEAKSQKKADNE